MVKMDVIIDEIIIKKGEKAPVLFKSILFFGLLSASWGISLRFSILSSLYSYAVLYYTQYIFHKLKLCRC